MRIGIKHQEIQFFPRSDKPFMLFCLLINDAMPTTVGILDLSAGQSPCSGQLKMKYDL